MSAEIHVGPNAESACDTCVCEALLEEKLVAKEPFGLFQRWFLEAQSSDNIVNPEAMCLATATANVNEVVSKESFSQFPRGFLEAQSNKDVVDPEAMCLATATTDGIPSARYVFLSGHGKEEGFRFFTNSDSRKAQEMAENPNVALTFYWAAQERCIRIEGKVEPLSKAVEVDYFCTKTPFDGQITYLVSDQSKPIADRAQLWRKHMEMTEEYKPQYGKKVPVPQSWVGYAVRPTVVEFHQDHANRLSDRIRFRYPTPNEVCDGYILHPGDDGWVFERLAP